MSKEDKFDEIVSAINKEFDNFIFLVEDIGTVEGDAVSIGTLLLQACVENEDFKHIVEYTSDFIKSRKFKEYEMKFLEEERMKSGKYND